MYYVSNASISNSIKPAPCPVLQCPDSQLHRDLLSHLEQMSPADTQRLKSASFVKAELRDSAEETVSGGGMEGGREGGRKGGREGGRERRGNMGEVDPLVESCNE